MVPELASGAAAESAGLTCAARRAAQALPAHWVAVAGGPLGGEAPADSVGTFAGYGADVQVSLSPTASGPPRQLPLCALITGWLRGQVNPAAAAQVRVFDDELGSDAAVACGRALRAELDASSEPVGVLVVADGAHTLTPAAPGGFDPDSVAVQQHWDDALAAGDVAALAGMDGVLGRVAYQVLAGLAGPGARATELYRGAPFGVGYFVGTWLPGRVSP
jgi:hypothetical protein